MADSLTDQVAAAKAEGWSDKDIYQFLSQHPLYERRVKAALDAGHTPEQIYEFLGLKYEGSTSPKGEEVRSAPLTNSADRLARAVTLGATTPAQGVAKAVAQALKGDFSFGKNYSEGVAEAEAGQRAYEQENPLTAGALDVVGSAASAGGISNAITGALRTAGTLPGAYASRFLSGATEGTGALAPLARAGSGIATGARQGAEVGALTAPLFGEDVGKGAERGATAGAVLGTAAQAYRGVANTLSNPIPAERARLAQWAEDNGIHVRGSQISNNSAARFTDSGMSDVPLTGRIGQNATQRDQFMRRVSQTFGEDSPVINDEVMNRAQQRLGATFNNLSAVLPVQRDPDFARDIARLRLEIRNSVPVNEQAPLFNQIQSIEDMFGRGNTINPGEMRGEDFHSLIRHGGPLWRMQRSKDSNLRHWAGEIEDTLVDALGRTAQQNGNQAQLGEFRAAQRQYKNLRIAHEWLKFDEPEGVGDPTRLANFVAQRYKDQSNQGTISERIAGDMGMLAQVGRGLLSDTGKVPSWTRRLAGTTAVEIPAIGAGIIMGEGLDPTSLARNLAVPLAVARGITAMQNLPGYTNRLIQRSLGPHLPAMAPAGIVGGAAALENKLQER